jgi:hypothetical protein
LENGCTIQDQIYTKMIDMVTYIIIRILFFNHEGLKDETSLSQLVFIDKLKTLVQVVKKKFRTGLRIFKSKHKSLLKRIIKFSWEKQD